MRLDDHMMTILTGLVLAITLGTVAQKSDVLIDLFSAEEKIVARDDVYYLRSGKSHALDVTLNDAAPDTAQLTIVDPPQCGNVSPQDGAIAFHDTGNCAGVQTFTYCLRGSDDACSLARVSLNIRATTPKKADLVPLTLADDVTAPRDAATSGGIVVAEALATDGDRVVPTLSAFVVTVTDPKAQPPRYGAPDFARSLGRYILAAPQVDLDAPPDNGVAGRVTFQRFLAPLDPARSAGFLHSHTKPDPDSSDPAAGARDGAIFAGLGTGGLPNDLGAGLGRDGDAADAPVAAVTDDPTRPLRPDPAPLGDRPDTNPTRPLGSPDPSRAEIVGPGALPEPLDTARPQRLSFGAPALDGVLPHAPLAMGLIGASGPDARFEPALSEPARALRDRAVPIEEARLTVGTLDDVPQTEPADVSRRGCPLVATARAEPGAVILVRINAPCAGGETVMIQQGKLVFQFLLPEDGRYAAVVPAMAAETVLDVRLGAPSADTVSLTVETPEIETVARALLLRDRRSPLALAVREFDTSTGAERLVTAKSALPFREARLLGRGTIRRYPAENGHVAEVYSLSRDSRTQSLMVDLELTGEIPAARCGTEDRIGLQRAGTSSEDLHLAAITLSACDQDVLAMTLPLEAIMGDVRLARR